MRLAPFALLLILAASCGPPSEPQRAAAPLGSAAIDTEEVSLEISALM